LVRSRRRGRLRPAGPCGSRRRAGRRHGDRGGGGVVRRQGLPLAVRAVHAGGLRSDRPAAGRVPPARPRRAL